MKRRNFRHAQTQADSWHKHKGWRRKQLLINKPNTRLRKFFTFRYSERLIIMPMCSSSNCNWVQSPLHAGVNMDIIKVIKYWLLLLFFIGKLHTHLVGLTPTSLPSTLLLQGGSIWARSHWKLIIIVSPPSLLLFSSD